MSIVTLKQAEQYGVIDKMLQIMEQEERLHVTDLATVVSVSNATCEEIVKWLSKRKALRMTSQGFVYYLGDPVDIEDSSSSRGVRAVVCDHMKCLINNPKKYVSMMYSRGFRFGSYKTAKKTIEAMPDFAIASIIYPDGRFALFPKSNIRLYESSTARLITDHKEIRKM